MPLAPSVHRVTAVIPDTPAAWSGAGTQPEYSLRWIDASGTARSQAARAGDEVRIDVPRGFAQAVTAFPDLYGTAMRPAAALYPWCLSGSAERILPTAADRLELGFGAGYASAVAGELAAIGMDAWQYPLDRLEGAWKARGADPWLLEPLEAARRLRDGQFRPDLFRTPVSHSVSLPPCGSGGDGWVPRSPFGPVPAAGTVWLCPGLHAFAGSGGRLEVLVGDDGSASWVRIPRPP